MELADRVSCRLFLGYHYISSLNFLGPFGVNEGVTVYLDESLRKHEAVYPAVGTDHSGVKLTIPELEKCSGSTAWVDVCKQPE